LDGSGVVGVVEGKVGEQRVDRRETVVARGHTVVTVVFEVVQERGDQRCVDLADVQSTGRLAGSLGGEADQEAQAGLVSGDGVGAGVALADQPVGEERL
jgi:hypothetical protein